MRLNDTNYNVIFYYEQFLYSVWFLLFDVYVSNEGVPLYRLIR